MAALSTEDVELVVGPWGPFESLARNAEGGRAALDAGRFVVEDGWPNVDDSDADHLADAVTVARFLKGGFTDDRVLSGFDTLEAALVKSALLAADNESGGVEAVLDALKRRVKPVVGHLLLDVLARYLAEHGFVIEAPKEGEPRRWSPVVPLSLLENPTFGGLLEARKHLKDPLVGLAHGEFSHMIQWYVIVQAWSAGTLKLRTSPPLTYEFLGRQYRRAMNLPLWWMVCDRVRPDASMKIAMAADADDLRSPDCVNLSFAPYPSERNVALRDRAKAAGNFVEVERVLESFAANVARSSKRWPVLTRILQMRMIKRTLLLQRAAALRGELEAVAREVVDDVGGEDAALDFVEDAESGHTAKYLYVLMKLDKNDPIAKFRDLRSSEQLRIIQIATRPTFDGRVRPSTG